MRRKIVALALSALAAGCAIPALEEKPRPEREAAERPLPPGPVFPAAEEYKPTDFPWPGYEKDDKRAAGSGEEWPALEEDLQPGFHPGTVVIRTYYAPLVPFPPFAWGHPWRWPYWYGPPPPRRP